MSHPAQETEERNPYANHPQLSNLEADVLYEYLKLSKMIKRVDVLAKETAVKPNEPLLAELRVLEKKMGLVLTLFKASVWAMITDNQAEEERLQMEQQMRDEEERRRHEEMEEFVQ